MLENVQKYIIVTALPALKCVFKPRWGLQRPYRFDIPKHSMSQSGSNAIEVGNQAVVFFSSSGEWFTSGLAPFCLLPTAYVCTCKRHAFSHSLFFTKSFSYHFLCLMQEGNSIRRNYWIQLVTLHMVSQIFVPINCPPSCTRGRTISNSGLICRTKSGCVSRPSPTTNSISSKLIIYPQFMALLSSKSTSPLMENTEHFSE